MYIRINFDTLNDILNEVRHFHDDFQKIKKNVDMVLEDTKNLLIILVIGK